MHATAEFVDVSKSYGERVALSAFTLTIAAGEVLGLVGPNGAGKTTALRCLAGLHAPDQGCVRVAGIDVQLDPLAARRCLAFVPDGAPLYANLSPRAHLALVGRLFGLEEATIAAESERLLAAFELSDRRDDPVGAFSRGMRQKTALACALIARPKLLVLDEPLEGLDAPTTAMVKELLRAWAARGGAVLYTSHLLDVVERVCDRIAVLAHGKLLAQGTLAELRASSGADGTLEEVFRTLTHAEDPAAAARRALG
jgi:ABC-2 type transport system ATP-binding protein